MNVSSKPLSAQLRIQARRTRRSPSCSAILRSCRTGYCRSTACSGQWSWILWPLAPSRGTAYKRLMCVAIVVTGLLTLSRSTWHSDGQILWQRISVERHATGTASCLGCGMLFGHLVLARQGMQAISSRVVLNQQARMVVSLTRTASKVDNIGC